MDTSDVVVAGAGALAAGCYYDRSCVVLLVSGKVVGSDYDAGEVYALYIVVAMDSDG